MDDHVHVGLSCAWLCIDVAVESCGVDSLTGLVAKDRCGNGWLEDVAAVEEVERGRYDSREGIAGCAKIGGVFSSNCDKRRQEEDKQENHDYDNTDCDLGACSQFRRRVTPRLIELSNQDTVDCF